MTVFKLDISRHRVLEFWLPRPGHLHLLVADLLVVRGRLGAEGRGREQLAEPPLLAREDEEVVQAGLDLVVVGLGLAVLGKCTVVAVFVHEVALRAEHE